MNYAAEIGVLRRLLNATEEAYMDQFYRLCASGLTIEEACQHLGVPLSKGCLWGSWMKFPSREADALEARAMHHMRAELKSRRAMQ